MKMPPVGQEVRLIMREGSSYGDARQGRWEPFRTMGGFILTDCVHPLQNCYCPEEEVEEWAALK